MNLEQILTELVAETANLPSEAIDRNADFFEEGWIDSLGLFRLLVTAEQRTGIELSPSAALEEHATTIAGLVRLFREEEDG